MSRAIDGDALIKSINGNPFTTDSVKSYIRVSVAKMPTIEPERKCDTCPYRTPDLIDDGR